MKRRDFLSSSAGLAGALLPAFGWAQARPCPPNTFGVGGGTSVNTSCSVGDAEADWLARSTAAGVLWAHDFRYQEEVTQFREGAPNWVTTDGIGNGKCVECLVPKGLPDGFHYVYYDSVSGWEVRDGTTMSQPSYGQSNADWVWRASGYYGSKGGIVSAGWWRPFSPLNAGGNGLPTPDRAANDTVPLRTWAPGSNVSGYNYNWKGGYFGHPSVQNSNPTWGGLTQAQTWLGHDFYLQFRVKLGRWRNGDTGLPPTGAAKALQLARYPAGKLVFIGTTGTTPLHEIVIRSQPIEPRQMTSGARFEMYTGQGYSINLTKNKSIQGKTVEVLQPGGAYENSSSLAETCYFEPNYLIANGQSEGYCWYWPVEEWVTVLVHVIPGRHNSSWNGSGAVYKDTGVEVWAARQGETSYTKIVGVGAAAVSANEAFPFVFDTAGLHPAAWNAFLPTNYMNNAPSLKAFYQRFTQVILSKQFIPCPQV